MTTIDVFVKKEIEIPDTVTIKGVTSHVDHDDGDDDERYAYSYYLCHIEGPADSVEEDRYYEIRVYDQGKNDEVSIVAIVDYDIVEDCNVLAESGSVTIAIRSLEKFLDEYEE
jgi:hypothetical protein